MPFGILELLRKLEFTGMRMETFICAFPASMNEKKNMSFNGSLKMDKH
jgi:hypothetical protein